MIYAGGSDHAAKISTRSRRDGRETFAYLSDVKIESNGSRICSSIRKRNRLASHKFYIRPVYCPRLRLHGDRMNAFPSSIDINSNYGSAYNSDHGTQPDSDSGHLSIPVPVPYSNMTLFSSSSCIQFFRISISCTKINYSQYSTRASQRSIHSEAPAAPERAIALRTLAAHGRELTEIVGAAGCVECERDAGPRAAWVRERDGGA
ncbi:hypothetical protein EVAR_80475_1 [Eumeta japonica]|uniref:Uncharacterized protein n=1 Tax=Eumeta variegata TaxID=151549 RepID=A0A4C1YPY7_EUMVA|nr:hypothetical protein EVAR_80475_1 [Eumeta japonica]